MSLNDSSFISSHCIWKVITSGESHTKRWQASILNMCLKAVVLSIKMHPISQNRRHSHEKRGKENAKCMQTCKAGNKSTYNQSKRVSLFGEEHDGHDMRRDSCHMRYWKSGQSDNQFEISICMQMIAGHWISDQVSLELMQIRLQMIF
jgi:hypothetical protein